MYDISVGMLNTLLLQILIASLCMNYTWDIIKNIKLKPPHLTTPISPLLPPHKIPGNYYYAYIMLVSFYYVIPLTHWFYTIIVQKAHKKGRCRNGVGSSTVFCYMFLSFIMLDVSWNKIQKKNHQKQAFTQMCKANTEIQMWHQGYCILEKVLKVYKN